MNWARWMHRPRLLVGLTLAFALVPVWLAVVTYRDARHKDEQVFQTTARVIGHHFQNEFERDAFLPRELRNRGRTLDDAALRAGKMMPSFAPRPWMDRLPHVLSLGYAELVEGKLIVRWKSDERVPTMTLGDDLTAIPGVREAMAAPQADPSPVAASITPEKRMLILAAHPGNGKDGAIRGYMVGWIDLKLACQDPAIPQIRDGVLSAKPLIGNEPPRADTHRAELRILGAAWTAEISRGPRFSQQYGAPPPWFTFIAVGLSAVPLLLLASLAGRSAKLRAERDAERELVQQQRFFTQSVSHEFRTPLGIILSGADLLESYADKLTPERRAELLTEIKDNTRHMTEMVERVLLLGRIESSRLPCERERVNVAELCRDVVRKLAAEGRITISAPAADANLDASILSSVLGNLLSNAVKYSPPGKPVMLEAVLENERLTFIVSDEGIGIPVQDLARVCEPFHRSSNVGETPGTGLGLAIAQRCAELHGGTLSIASTVGIGTTATVTIPIS